MSYSDWIQSPKSNRVWLEESMTALGQFAFISPIHRVRHWNPAQRKRVKCWAKEGRCVHCDREIPKINEFTYGIYHPQSEYEGGGKHDISYMSVTLSTHTHFQQLFSKLIAGTHCATGLPQNPTEMVFEIKRTKIMTSQGKPVNGYQLTSTEMDVFVKEKFRPSLEGSEEQTYTWVVPEEIVNFLKEKDGQPITMIDLFLILKDNFAGYSEKELKSFTTRLCENNDLNLRKARKKWI